MGRNGQYGGYFKGLDGFGKTMEDVKIRTGFGGFLTLASAILIVTLVLVEFVDYRTLHLNPSIVVDKSRGEKLIVDMNITFPRVPCYLLSVDLMDISGEHQNDVNHDMTKTRLNPDGTLVSASVSKGLKGELDTIAATRAPGYCGSCYGGTPPESGCCNTCEEVRESYVRRGWSFSNPDGIEQCVQEHWSDKIKEQEKEGCNMNGQVKVNKVIGNFHMSPGRSFQTNAMHVHDLVPYLQTGNSHDFGHIIHKFAFLAEHQSPDDDETRRIKTSLGIVNPLDGIKAHTEESNYMFQYFLKVVGTEFHLLDQRVVKTHQYSVTQYERDLTKSSRGGTDELGHQTSHGYAGVPGLFFNYEISPMQVIHKEYRQSFAHFATSTCAIIGGVLTVAGLIDSAVYGARNRIKLQSSDGGFESHSRTGKFL
ncbi:uncharacterized protein MELLADRAFT_105603 [Melampsora larici-populina 98AG31]|uniref:Uncharacterized protein n=1 Tax=Melampsora larici-populina (strain 98AG31 / pathotype 3-4-7) TaxID=747676 RepID=F4RIS1_MELLP|nr:uncharacterized protein MELLADRAFT_105603 [Melampsora larici-populina 98AG31]EGG07782.1 hypothetical protein MELLADRAFT_105603 [Melampsora larici-populina 98AG31]